MPPSVSNVFEEFKQGTTPSNQVEYDESGRVEWMLARSLRNDVVIIAHKEETTYYAIRIEPEYESRNAQLQRHFKNPHKPFSNKKRFERCRYQTQHVELPHFREENTSVSYRMVHESCHWNRRGVSRTHTANSSKQLQRAWMEFRHDE